MNEVRVYILCEGQTEESFIKEVLYPHFRKLEIYLTPIILKTDGTSKGGVPSYANVKKQILNTCSDSKAYVTTMLDMYGLPESFPCADGKYADLKQHASAICSAMEADISRHNFIPNIIVHEFETILFSRSQAFEEWFDCKCTAKLEQILNEHGGNPELINNGRDTAPSKRIIGTCGEKYNKILHGSLIAIDIGLPVIRDKCRLFDSWLLKLESLSLTVK